MASRWGYLQQFLRHPGTIGAVTPSSAALARAMADQIDFRRQIQDPRQATVRTTQIATYSCPSDDMPLTWKASVASQ